ncbi:MAG: prepilin-type N-terminal cleavage/methylation domain-containing protein [Elusimicrobiota bacterium]|nr:prepilin-type N-terminal cleavage/methylation domain-containing protein [Elusimicrobiota bacterium]
MAARLTRRIESGRTRARRGNAGYTLVEVMVAMLLTSIMVTSVFSVALTVKTGGSKGESKIKAAAGAKMVAALLKNYVTAETGAASTTLIPGPCAGAANNWSISCNGIVDACPLGGSDCYALAPGTHTLTGVMGDFENLPTDTPPGKGARVSYYVNTDLVVNGRPVPVVTITATWTD